MSGIFLSYRREDSSGYTGRLFDKLSEHFGKNNVFMDISDIEPGLDFIEAIEKAVASCDVLIAVIGNQWLVDSRGQRRLDDPEDFVHLEIISSLESDVRVIPVLVSGATMPDSKDLPEDLQKLSRRQAHEISDSRWDYDVERLIQILEKVVEIPSQPPPQETEVQKVDQFSPNESKRVIKKETIGKSEMQAHIGDEPELKKGWQRIIYFILPLKEFKELQIRTEQVGMKKKQAWQALLNEFTVKNILIFIRNYFSFDLHAFYWMFRILIKIMIIFLLLLAALQILGVENL